MKIGEDVENALMKASTMANQELNAKTDLDGNVYGDASELLEIMRKINVFLEDRVEGTYSVEGGSE